MRKTETYGTIKAGRLAIAYRDRFVRSLATLPDGRYKVIVEKVSSKHSDSQRAYYHAVVVNEFREGYKEITGEALSHEEAHDVLKLKCNGRDRVYEQTGEVLTVIGSTKQLTKSEYAEYVDACIKFIYLWTGRIVPQPGEQTEINF